MIKTRVIPALLLRGAGLVKTVNFHDPRYLGDPINIVKIFNEKEVDEIVLLDIAATHENRGPDYRLLERIAGEAFMPLGYGGGIRTIQDMRMLFSIGFEKVIINSAVNEKAGLIHDAARSFGSQSIVVSLDVKKDWIGKYRTYTHGGRHRLAVDPVSYARDIVSMGAGEILLTSIDRDGSMRGYDISLIKSVSSAVTIPVIAAGGAGKVEDMGAAVKEGGASAAAAGSIFVFQGPHRAVLISYPKQDELRRIFKD
jgi:cyclase